MDKDKAIKEIKQLKELLDSGILTQEEYDKKSSDLKKIILDSENKKIEPSETEKEFWKEKAENKPQINPPKTEEKKPDIKLEVQEEVELKTSGKGNSNINSEEIAIEESDFRTKKVKEAGRNFLMGLGSFLAIIALSYIFKGVLLNGFVSVIGIFAFVMVGKSLFNLFELIRGEKY